MTGSIPPELGNLSHNLSNIDLNNNQLTGTIPRTFITIPFIDEFLFPAKNGLCAPSDDEFQGWLQRVDSWSGEICEPNVSIEQSSSIPTDFVLHGNYPNPFQESTSLRFDLPYNAHISVDLVDITGRVVYQLSPVSIQAGWEREIPLRNLSLPPWNVPISIDCR